MREGGKGSTYPIRRGGGMSVRMIYTMNRAQALLGEKKEQANFSKKFKRQMGLKRLLTLVSQRAMAAPPLRDHQKNARKAATEEKAGDEEEHYDWTGRRS